MTAQKYFQALGELGANPHRPRAFSDQEKTALDTGTRFETEFLSSMGSPSLSSFYKVRLDLAPANSADSLEAWLQNSGVYNNDGNLGQERFSLLATEAMLPGATLATSTETGSRQGVVERFAAQRTFNDVAVTYYLTGDYRSLTLFQEWINYINPLYIDNKSPVLPSATGYPDQSNFASNNFFRYRYPAQYKRTMSITKFERNIDTTLGSNIAEQNVSSKPQALSYKFINVFPTSIQDVALSYSASQLLQVTVNFAYDRYVMIRSEDITGFDESSPSNDKENNNKVLREDGQNISNNPVVTGAK